MESITCSGFARHERRIDGCCPDEDDPYVLELTDGVFFFFPDPSSLLNAVVWCV